MSDWSNSIEAQKERFDDLYYETWNDIKDRLIDHFFQSNNWTNEQIEDITGKTLWSSDGFDMEELSPEEKAKYTNAYGEFDLRAYEEDTRRISLETWDSEYLDDMLRTSSDFDLDTMLQFAKSFGADLSGIEIPYRIIVFEGQTQEGDPNNIAAYLVCRNKEELIDTWKKNLPKYEGHQYSVEDGDGKCQLSGVYDPNDLDDLEALPSYIMTYEYTCNITAYAELDERTLQNVAEDMMPYDVAMTELWEGLDCGCCQNVDSKEAHYGVLEVTGTFEGTVQAYSKTGAIAKAQDDLNRVDFGDLEEIEFHDLQVNREESHISMEDASKNTKTNVKKQDGIDR